MLILSNDPASHHQMTAKEHYDNRLGNLYSWMADDFEPKRKSFQKFLVENGLEPNDAKVAIDLGAGHGIQSVALRNLGYRVIAMDFNKQLLAELQTNAGESGIQIIEDDIRTIKKYAELQPDLILCCGDTITHLESRAEVKTFINDCANSLNDNGKLVLSFRDYSIELAGVDRFVPVKSDGERILTCFLEYEVDRVKVTDLLYEKTGSGWVQKVSSYSKVRIKVDEVVDMVSQNRMRIVFNENVERMQTIIAEKVTTKN